MYPDWLSERRVAYGGWCGIASSFSIELMGYAGFDWLCVDLQHGMVEMSDLVSMLQAIAVTKTPAFVRVASNDSGAIMKALDAGATGIVIPMVNSRRDAEQAVQACRYPPLGIRSWGPARASLPEAGYTTERANDRVLCVVMIETVEAADCLSDILSVPGVDIALVGPSDLAVSMNLAPQIGPISGTHRSTIETIAATCDEHGVVPGIYGGNAAATIAYRELGYRFLAVATDVALLRQGAQTMLRQVRE